MLNVPTSVPVENVDNLTPSADHKTKKRILLTIAIVLPFVLLIGIFIWYFALYQKPGTEIVPAKPTPGVGFGSLNPYASLCVNFQNTQAKIPCEDAVKLALMQAQGNIINVSIESIQITNANTSPPARENINIWAVDFRLNKPLFIKGFEKEVRVLRIGIPVNDYEGVYKKALE